MDRSEAAIDKRANLMKEIAITEAAFDAAKAVKSQLTLYGGLSALNASLASEADPLNDDLKAKADEFAGKKRIFVAAGGYATAKYVVKEDLDTSLPEGARCPNFLPDLSGDTCRICKNGKCTNTQRGRPGHLPSLQRCGKPIGLGTKLNLNLTGPSNGKNWFFRHHSLCTCMKKKDEVRVNILSMEYALFRCSEKDRTNYLALLEQYYNAKVTAKHEHAHEEARSLHSHQQMEQYHQQSQMEQYHQQSHQSFQHPFQMQQSQPPIPQQLQIHRQSSTCITADSSSESNYGGMIDGTPENTATVEATLEVVEESDNGWVGV
jgi:hypothetical protein